MKPKTGFLQILITPCFAEQRKRQIIQNLVEFEITHQWRCEAVARSQKYLKFPERATLGLRAGNWNLWKYTVQTRLQTAEKQIQQPDRDTIK